MTIKPPTKFEYLHDHCGTVTEVSGSIVSNMHVDPYFYRPGLTICANCGLVADAHCTILETGETLDVYCKRLKSEKGVGYHCVRWGIYIVFMIIGGVVLPIMTLSKGHVPQPWNSLCGVLVGGLAAMAFGRFIRLLICRTGLV